MIAIPNMDKPKGCIDCPVNDIVCELWTEVANIKAHKHKDCPLIDIVTCGECIHRHEHEWYNTCDKHIGHGFEDGYFCKDGERNSKNNSNAI